MKNKKNILCKLDLDYKVWKLDHSAFAFDIVGLA